MERAEDLLEDAEDFLGAARDLMDSGRWAKVCFNSQQCVELSIKAALNSYGLEVKGHSLLELLTELGKVNEGVLRFVDKVKILDQYYIATRYANTFYSGSAKRHFTKKQAEEALRFADEVFHEMRSIASKQKASRRG